MPPIDDLLQKTIARLAERRRFPESTYRIQFHAGFTFRDAVRQVPYLHDLGVTHLYASPFLKARPGSQHGYDITSHQTLNPEIGSEGDFAELVRALHERGMGLILDMVPNHMGVVANDNVWWNDVLENGPASPYATYFDIAWHGSPRRQLRDRVLLPVLGDAYGKVLERQEIKLEYDAGAFTVRYFDYRFPLTPSSYRLILERGVADLEATLGAEAHALLDYRSILTAVSHLPLPTEADAAKVAEGRREKEVVKRRLDALVRDSAEVRTEIDKLLAVFNGTPGDPRSFDAFDALLDAQPYRLSFWRVAADEINYRRFFDVNELAALSMERPEVFADTHKLVMRLLADGAIDGLRIDHPDGLYDPAQYLHRLQLAYVAAVARTVYDSDPELQKTDWKEMDEELTRRLDAPSEGSAEEWRRSLYVVVEKILGAHEALPEDWETNGTSGYDFLALLNGLFVDPDGAKPFTRFYQEFTGLTEPLPDMVYRNKLLTLRVALSSELQMLAYQLDKLAQKSRYSRDFTLNSLRDALRQVIAFFPVYRSYITPAGVHDTDRKYVELAARRAMRANPALNKSLIRFVRDMLLLKFPDGATEVEQTEQARFAGKFQQVTSPVMAKGVEDTSFYVYGRFLSLNEVGGDPGKFGATAEAVHQANCDRRERWSFALSPLSTHDTKRSEDVRARLNVLSEIPDEWTACVRRWSELNATHRRSDDDGTAPDANEEYFLYQTLVGAWPFEPINAEEHAKFRERIQAHTLKALHEAKVHSTWINPDEAYDEAVHRFVAAVLDESANGAFLSDLRAFVRRVARFGLINGLAQTLVRITAPGAPDTYQGTELWDFSLVDPDNRRPVDYERRRALLGDLLSRHDGTEKCYPVGELLSSMEDDRAKLFVTALALRCRRDHPGLFSTGSYEPATTTGPREGHAFGFVRRHGDATAVVAVPRLTTQLGAGADKLPLGPEVWLETRLLTPGLSAGTRLRNVFSGETLTVGEHQGLTCVMLADVFRLFPVALLMIQAR